MKFQNTFVGFLFVGHSKLSAFLLRLCENIATVKFQLLQKTKFEIDEIFKWSIDRVSQQLASGDTLISVTTQSVHFLS